MFGLLEVGGKDGSGKCGGISEEKVENWDLYIYLSGV